MAHLPRDLFGVLFVADSNEEKPARLCLAARGNFQRLGALAFESLVGGERFDAALPRRGLDAAKRAPELRLPDATAMATISAVDLSQLPSESEILI